MGRIAELDIAAAAAILGPATADEIAAHLGSNRTSIAAVFASAARKGLIQKDRVYPEAGEVTWVISPEGQRAVEDAQELAQSADEAY